jgi:hypothetical protein
MNIQDEMDRIFKMQKDNLANERKFKELGETFDTRKEKFPRWGTQVFGR